MATPMVRNCVNNFIKSSCSLLQRVKTDRVSSVEWRCVSLATSAKDGPERDPEDLFVKQEVQTILKKITGLNLEKIFRTQKLKDLEAPKYKMLTDSQLKQYNDEIIVKTQDKLQMPPVMKAWNETGLQILSKDDEIADFETSGSRYVFTDISYGLSNRKRAIVMREPNGVLRTTEKRERDRILQVYFPTPGKMHKIPKMFDEENLEKILAEHRYEYVLDRACVQFEPDDPHYIRVSQRTYEHIASHKRFDDLLSTRHFGPMAFYFAFYGKIDQLLIDMLLRDSLSDAEDLVKLYHIIHPTSQSAVEAQQKTFAAIPLIQLFAKYDATNGGIIEMALQSFQEAQKMASDLNSS